MKRTGIWVIVSTLGFLLLTVGWFAIPINYDFTDAVFSGWLNFPLGYELYMIIGWLMGAVKYLLAAAYALALYVVLKDDTKRVKHMLLMGAALVVLGLLVLLSITQLGWFYVRWLLSFASAMLTSGLLVIVLAFGARLVRRAPRENGGGEVGVSGPK